MCKNTRVPASTPRNAVMLALVRLARSGNGRHVDARRIRDQNRKDLDQRVREYGEW